MELHLIFKNIGPQGAQHLANALLQNKVTFSSRSLLPFNTYFKKTLTILDLTYNEIGPQGAQYFATTLEQNKVTSLQYFYPAIHYFLYIDTHQLAFTGLSKCEPVINDNFLKRFKKIIYNTKHSSIMVTNRNGRA
jgi:hypothetical protein